MAKEAEENQAQNINAAKLKALQATIDKIEKDYGKGTIMKLGDQPEWSDAQVIPSGSISLLIPRFTAASARNRVLNISLKDFLMGANPPDGSGKSFASAGNCAPAKCHRRAAHGAFRCRQGPACVLEDFLHDGAPGVTQGPWALPPETRRDLP